MSSRSQIQAEGFVVLFTVISVLACIYLFLKTWSLKHAKDALAA